MLASRYVVFLPVRPGPIPPGCKGLASDTAMEAAIKTISFGLWPVASGKESLNCSPILGVRAGP